MKAVITDGRGNVKLSEIAEPQLQPYQCLCQITACATCTGTDKRLVMGEQVPRKGNYPAILGHESFGTVVQCGPCVRHIKTGDRFLRPAAAYPGNSLDGYVSWMGGFAEYGVVTDTQAIWEDSPATPIPPYSVYQQMIPPKIKLDAANAVMLVTLKETASSIRDLGIGFGSKVLILGSGSVSMALGYFAKLAGADPVITAGRREQPLNDCRKTGADFVINVREEDLAAKTMEYTAQEGVDFVIDAAGNADLFIAAGAALAKYGALCAYAVGEPLSIDKVAKPGRKWKYIQSGADEASAHRYLLNLVRLQSVPFRNFYSHIMPFADFEDGFKLLVKKQASKIVFTML